MKKTMIFGMIAIFLGLGAGALITILGGQLPLPDAAGFSIAGWLGTSLVIALAVFLLLIAWSWGGGSKTLLWMVVLAFAIRLVLGVIIGVGIPAWGHDNAENNSGYLLLDPYERDTEAWNLAKSGDSIIQSAASGFGNDQYGGVLSISAFLYRSLSADGHRPFLVLIVGAFMAAFGLPFLWVGLQKLWGHRIAVVTCWIVALYPEGILHGMTQGREPFIIGLFSIMFWAAMGWDGKKWQSWVGMAVPLLLLLWISAPAALFSLVFFIVWIVLQDYAEKVKKWQLRAFWIILGVVMILMGLLYWSWFGEVAKWDALEYERGSGFIQLVSSTLGEQWRVPFLTVYGLTQPMLFAALVATTTAPIFNIIGGFRAFGWYIIAPFLILAWIRMWKENEQTKKRLIIWSVLFSTAWILLASMRSGGDLWDNPRYRILFLPVIALVAAWALDWAKAHKDRWLACLLWLDLIFNAVFFVYYLWRYYEIIPISIDPRILSILAFGITLALSSVVIVSTVIISKRDRKKAIDNS